MAKKKGILNLSLSCRAQTFESVVTLVAHILDFVSGLISPLEQAQPTQNRSQPLKIA